MNEGFVDDDDDGGDDNDDDEYDDDDDDRDNEDYDVCINLINREASQRSTLKRRHQKRQ